MHVYQHDCGRGRKTAHVRRQPTGCSHSARTHAYTQFNSCVVNSQSVALPCSQSYFVLRTCMQSAQLADSVSAIKTTGETITANAKLNSEEVGGLRAKLDSEIKNVLGKHCSCCNLRDRGRAATHANPMCRSGHQWLLTLLPWALSSSVVHRLQTCLHHLHVARGHRLLF